MVYPTDRSKAVVPVLVLLFVALWFILRGDLFYVLPCVILFLCFSVHLALRLPRLGNRELILVLFVRSCSICACLVLSVFSSSWCLGRAAVCDCGIPWTFLLLFFFFLQKHMYSVYMEIRLFKFSDFFFILLYLKYSVNLQKSSKTMNFYPSYLSYR